MGYPKVDYGKINTKIKSVLLLDITNYVGLIKDIIINEVPYEDNDNNLDTHTSMYINILDVCLNNATRSIVDNKYDNNIDNIVYLIPLLNDYLLKHPEDTDRLYGVMKNLIKYIANEITMSQLYEKALYIDNVVNDCLYISCFPVNGNMGVRIEEV